MSRSWITGIAVASCVSLLAFAPFARQDGKPGAAPKAMALAPTAWVITFELAKWDTSKSPGEQPGFSEHLANCQKLSKEGTLLVAGTPEREGHEQAGRRDDDRQGRERRRGAPLVSGDASSP